MTKSAIMEPALAVGNIYNEIGLRTECICILIAPEELDNFKQALVRACATWQDQPKSIRALNDLFTFGKVMENMS